MSNAPSKPVSFSRPKVGYFSNRPRICYVSKPVILSHFRCVLGVKSFQFMLHTEINRQNPLKHMKREIKSVGGRGDTFARPTVWYVSLIYMCVFPWYEHCSLTRVLTENTC